MRWLLLLVACTSPAPPKCAPSVTLFEDYCQNMEAARCYFLHKPTDGF